MKQKVFHGFHKENGQAVVEAALVIPLIIIMICGMIDFGWIFYNQLLINNCSREGARYAIVNSGSADLLSDVTDQVHSVYARNDDDDITVTVQVINGTDMKVTVTSVVKILTPIAGIFTEDQQIVLSSTSVMRIE